MNEKLKEVAQTEFDARYPIEWNNYTIARAWAMEAWHNALAAAARGEIPGFQLVPVEPTEKMQDVHDEYLMGGIPRGQYGIYAAMLTASREEQK